MMDTTNGTADLYSKFQEDLTILFYKEMMRDEEFCKRVYAALTNIIWVYEGEEVSVSFRTAGGMIADILNEGCYMDWYCSAGEGVVDQNISDDMLLKGWIWKEWPEDPEDSYYTGK
jgi:hypothetical protein